MRNKPIWLFLCCCGLPLLLAYTAISLDWLPEQATNNGAFVEGEITVKNWRSEPGVLWTIALSAPTTCTAVCTQQIENLSNIHTALGKHQRRVNVAILGREHDDQSMSSYPNQPGLLPGGLYLVDHRGLVVLEYEYSLDELENRMLHKGMLKDLKKLLNFARSS